MTRAELVLNHNITNNPNDQIRPEDWENEAATGRTPDYRLDESGNWVSTKNCYEGDGDFIPEGTLLRDPDNTVDLPASDLQFGYTPAWYTTIQRDPFEWSFTDQTTGLMVGAQTPEEIAEKQADPERFKLVSGPRWRMTSNKFGQDLPGLEIPIIECSQPPYQGGTIRYETGDPITTTINLLDWSAANDRWANDDATSPLAYSAGWITTWSGTDTIPGQVFDSVEDPARCADTNADDDCVTALGTTLTDGFDVSFYVKGDIKPAQIYDVQLILEYEADPVGNVAVDYADAPDTYGTTLAAGGASSTVTGDSPRLGALVDTEDDAVPPLDATGDDLDNTDDEDGVTFSELKAGASGTATVTLGGTGFVNGWIDFNGDGDFVDAGEQVVTDATRGRNASDRRPNRCHSRSDVRPLPGDRRRRSRPNRLHRQRRGRRPRRHDCRRRCHTAA